VLVYALAFCLYGPGGICQVTSMANLTHDQCYQTLSHYTQYNSRTQEYKCVSRHVEVWR
jgi:hypothetical protein